MEFLASVDVLPPAFPGGRLLNDPRSQPHAKTPAAHSSSHLWMRWLHSIRLFFYLSHTFPFSDEQASLQLTTVDSELRLRLLSLHVARLTNLINPPTTNWCDKHQLPSTDPAVHKRRIHTRAITHYILPHTSYGADSLTSSSFRRVYPPCIPLHLLSLHIQPQRPLHYKSRPPSPQTLRYSEATAKLASIYPPFETADRSCHPYDL
jgi:hypothetical protein